MLRPLPYMHSARNFDESDPDLALAIGEIRDSAAREAISSLIRRAENLAQAVESLSRELREVDRHHAKVLERLDQHYGGEIAGILGALEDLEASRDESHAR